VVAPSSHQTAGLTQRPKPSTSIGSVAHALHCGKNPALRRWHPMIATRGRQPPPGCQLHLLSLGPSGRERPEK
jgi:hypothetical protein